MFLISSNQDSQADHNDATTDHSVGVIPDFHHVPPTSAVALESYMHLYLESEALAESTLKHSIGH